MAQTADNASSSAFVYEDFREVNERGGMMCLVSDSRNE